MKENNKKVVSVDSNDKTDCFAWRSKVKCDALKTKTCKDCAFYKKKENDESYKPKDVPAYHIDEENYSNEILNPKAKSEEELEIEMLQKMLEEKQAKLKAKKNRDFEM